MNEIPTRYNPKETEDKWYKFWEEKNYFGAKVNPSKKPFCIVIPPPNITGILHMGHALNNTYQDILIRYKRMQGVESLWMPGTDHAGIATQNVVEREIAKEGLKKEDLGREKFTERLWLWKEKYGDTIIHQLKKLGSSCDWKRTRFTLDEEYCQAVREAFVRLYEKGLIYQGDYIINWCPRCQTALSDEEAPYSEIQGYLYYIKYPLKEVTRPISDGYSEKPVTRKKIVQDYIVVATTRPETMLGDTAVAVNPKDKRYKKLVGKFVILPLMDREIEIISDDFVDIKFGTGAVKVTPAHDRNDFEIAKRHNLRSILVMSPDGRMNKNTGEFCGMDRFKAREAILEALKERGLLERIEPYKYSCGHCYRCHTIIEPYLSNQWFVKMKPLAEPAIDVVKKGEIKFYPKRWKKVYLNWMENIQDWCISRQIWWGHRLPVYYCKNCQETGKFQIPNSKFQTNPNNQIPKSKQNIGIIVSRVKPEKCPNCGSTDIYQDEDVLDTWFSSWLWPFATFDWPFPERRVENKEQGELRYFYPTSILVTAPEILFFWVARMIMAGLEFRGEIPFKTVFIHGTVRDTEGRKMSKSLGNIIDPLEIIEHCGTDALRFSLISLAAVGSDVFLSEEKFLLGRNFANKIWNASRFVLLNLNKELVNVDLYKFSQKEKLDLPNRWILSRFYSALKESNKAMDNYRFCDTADILYQFFWHEFCDWYLELTKSALVNREQSAVYRNTQIVMYNVLEMFLRVLHPFMPFITEEIWQRLTSKGDSIMIQPQPHLQKMMIDKETEKKMQVLMDLITAIRNLRSQIKIEPQRRILAIASTKNKETENLIQNNLSHILNLARLEKLEIKSNLKKPEFCVSKVLKDLSIYIPYKGVIDISKERERISKEKNEISQRLNLSSSHLKDKGFLKNAPKELIEKEREKVKELKEMLLELSRIERELE